MPITNLNKVILNIHSSEIIHLIKLSSHQSFFIKIRILFQHHSATLLRFCTHRANSCLMPCIDLVPAGCLLRCITIPPLRLGRRAKKSNSRCISMRVCCRIVCLRVSRKTSIRGRGRELLFILLFGRKPRVQSYFLPRT
jgi:hypothetical protein